MTTQATEKMFDVDTMIDNMEKNTNSFTGYIWPEQARDFARTMTGTAFQFSRAQAQAMRDLGEGVRKAFQI